MKILFLSDNFPPETNAPATRTYEHAMEWVRAGHDVSVITTAPNFPEGKLIGGYRNRWRSSGGHERYRGDTRKNVYRRQRRLPAPFARYVSFMITGGLAAFFSPRPDGDRNDLAAVLFVPWQGGW